MKYRKRAAVLFLILLSIVSCAEWFELEWDLTHIPNNMEFENHLSSYELFEGPMRNLLPAKGVYEFELATPLFTDYAEKQRLVRVPEGTSMAAQGSGLPWFPDGTLIAKTFYYFVDARYTAGLKRIIETRLLVKNEGKWNAAVYEWNGSQEEANLRKDGKDLTVRWIGESGSPRVTQYRIPSNAECTTCHLNNQTVTPIGLKLRNINMSRRIENNEVNQLLHFIDHGILEQTDLSGIEKLPEWDNPLYPLSKRARAYLDINCAHCHYPAGVASDKDLNLLYETPFAKTDIKNQKHNIPERMTSSWADERMPRIGTNEIHSEGVELIKKFMKQL